MPQEYIIWQDTAGWYGRYESKTATGSMTAVVGPCNSAAQAAAWITDNRTGGGGGSSFCSIAYGGGGMLIDRGGGGGRS